MRKVDMLRGTFFIACAALTSCATPWHGPKTVQNASGQTVCARHQTPLKTEVAYVKLWQCRLEAEHYARIRERFPNPMPAFFHTERSRDYPDRITVTYCELCAHDYEVAAAD